MRLSRARLELELVRRGWTGQDLAQAAGISAATVSAARRGRAVHASTVRRMAIALQRAPVIEAMEILLGDGGAQGDGR